MSNSPQETKDIAVEGSEPLGDASSLPSRSDAGSLNVQRIADMTGISLNNHHTPTESSHMPESSKGVAQNQGEVVTDRLELELESGGDEDSLEEEFFDPQQEQDYGLFGSDDSEEEGDVRGEDDERTSRLIEQSWIEWRQAGGRHPGDGKAVNAHYQPWASSSSKRRVAFWNRQGASSPSPSVSGSSINRAEEDDNNDSSGEAENTHNGTTAVQGISVTAGVPPLTKGKGKWKRLHQYQYTAFGSSTSSVSGRLTGSSWKSSQERLSGEAVAREDYDSRKRSIVICSLPIEVLSYIVAFLEPQDLTRMTLVNRLFYLVVTEDSCWKAAFLKYFGAGTIPFRRLDPKSWRGEYIRRTKLLQNWGRIHRKKVMLHPDIGDVTGLWTDTDHSNIGNRGYLAAGLREGTVAKCDPQLKKSRKDAVLRITELGHFEISVMAMDRNRVIWGFTTGEIAYSILASGTAGQTFQPFTGFHAGPVTSIKLVPDYLWLAITGGSDGVVKVWDTTKSRILCELATISAPTMDILLPTITHICCEPRIGVVAGTSRGEIYIWRLDIYGLFLQSHIAASQNSAGTIPVQLFQPQVFNDPVIIKLPEEVNSIKYLEVDFGYGHSGLITAQTTGSSVLHLYSLDTSERLAVLKSPDQTPLISSIHWDFPKYEKPMILLSNGADNEKTLSSSSPPSAQSGEKPPTEDVAARPQNHYRHHRHEVSSSLAVGYEDGSIRLWFLNDVFKRYSRRYTDGKKISSTQSGTRAPPEHEKEVAELHPVSKWEAHQMSRVTSIHVDKLVIISGSLDGQVKVWNPVNCKLVNFLYKGQSPAGAMAVNSYQCRCAVAFEEHVLTWDFSPEAAKDIPRRLMGKRAAQFSASPKSRIQNDIRHSLEESASQRYHDDLAKEQDDLIQKRFNNLEGLNMTDMTDEELVEYVKMLSRDQEEEVDAVRRVMEIQEAELLSLDQQQLARENANAEGSSSSVSSSTGGRSVTATAAVLGDAVSDRELEEEEELVRRAIEMSMLDMEGESSDWIHSGYHDHADVGAGFDNHHHFEHCNAQEHAHIALDHSWVSEDIVDVDTLDGKDPFRHEEEDAEVVQSVLQELQDAERAREEKQKALKQDGSDVWPSISISRTSSSLASGSSTSVNEDVSQPQQQQQPQQQAAKMSWSMIARTNSESSLPMPSSGAGQKQSIIRAYPTRTQQPHEVEDEETQLARILSLSMVEK
ncbi:hypothetical protein BGW38_005007 [Lunasporangiospora selenospora]|uniref:F-box domain-containing protein n=1 Tax=Lunasporangiospora selenospora TaxID=979761 RepID=A0A9P6KHI4_9FUNG|nr:hypothetical protein BGW38_005007 [Lunasporangiospora selenospora]